MTTKNNIANARPGKATDDFPGREFVITREFNAPRELVFAAWTDPQHLAQWWGPRGFTNPVCEWDARPGRAIHVVMRAPNGVDYPMGGEFREIIAPELLVFTSGALDEHGKMLFEFLHTAVFVDREAKTLLTLRSRVVATTPGAGKYIGGFEAGMTQSLERLEGHMAATAAQDREIVIARLGEHLASLPVILERTFDAPVEAVWRAITDAGQMKQWYFPQLESFKAEVGFETEFDVAEGEKNYRHIWKVVAVEAGKKNAYRWRYGDYPGDSLLTMELFEEGRKTRLKLTHAGLETFLPEQHPELGRENFVKGWTPFLDAALMEFLKKQVFQPDGR